MTTEQRLREAFQALADAVEVETTDWTPHPTPDHQGSLAGDAAKPRTEHDLWSPRRWVPVAAGVVVCGIVGAVLLVGGGRGEVGPVLTPVSVSAGPPGTESVGAPETSYTGRTQVAYQLYTHCGIDEAQVWGRFYEAVPPVPEPLPGSWGNPYQEGVMTEVSPTEAEFTDAVGHVVRFRVRPGATAFKQICK
ncbi:hypothetical protein [Actinocrispum sp. NPDC049592]|uniref:hypothetical protein n=1 Tax=Actinocrispum sp. NPDC049592 TaxID=3154835 RepID=UPI00342A708A